MREGGGQFFFWGGGPRPPSYGPDHLIACCSLFCLLETPKVLRTFSEDISVQDVYLSQLHLSQISSDLLNLINLCLGVFVKIIKNIFVQFVIIYSFNISIKGNSHFTNNVSGISNPFIDFFIAPQLQFAVIK